MNRFASLAYEYWKTHRVDELGGLTNHERFFAQLGEQISYQVAERTRELRQDGPPGEAHPAKIARFHRARQLAEEQVLHETLTTPAGRRPGPGGDG